MSRNNPTEHVLKIRKLEAERRAKHGGVRRTRSAWRMIKGHMRRNYGAKVGRR